MNIVIAAVDEKFGIGKAGVIPWRYPEDFRWFNRTTMGHTCIMGRSTYSEISCIATASKPILPGRSNYVLTSKPLFAFNATPITTLTDELVRSNRWNVDAHTYFIGGRYVFELGLANSDQVYLTKIPGDHQCDVFFPYELLNELFQLEDTVILPGEQQLVVQIWIRKSL